LPELTWLLLANDLILRPTKQGLKPIKVQVLRVMKGEIEEKPLDVRSWYGMCPYGIIVDDQTYLMILTKSSQTPGMYEPVNSGCSVRTLPVKSDAVTIDGEKLSLEELQSKYRLKKEN
jgi:hypothetical protein